MSMVKEFVMGTAIDKSVSISNKRNAVFASTSNNIINQGWEKGFQHIYLLMQVSSRIQLTHIGSTGKELCTRKEIRKSQDMHFMNKN